MRGLVYVLLSIALFISCSKDQKQAEKSIKGDWQVIEVLTIHKNASGEEIRKEEEGNLGNINFGESAADYEFVRNDSLYSGSSNWTLTSEKVNEGFFKVIKFTLEIDPLGKFEVTFEDATKNSEKNATEMTLIDVTNVDENFVQLILEK